jgi:hypothetical protein
MISLDYHADHSSGAFFSAEHAAPVASEVRGFGDDYILQGLLKGAGSGGMFLVEQRDSSGGLIVINRPQKPALADLLEKVRSYFSLSSEEMKSVLQVSSRKTYYNWLKGTSEPRGKSLDRIFLLNKVVKEWSLRGYPTEKVALNTPVLENESLMNLLASEEIDSEKVLFAGSRLQLVLHRHSLEEDDLF